MTNEDKGLQILHQLVQQYPMGTAALFTGAGLNGVNPSAHTLAAALRRGDVSFDGLYDRTLGASSSFNANTSPLMQLTMAEASKQSAPASSTKDTQKFGDILSGLLGAAGQAADVYNKFKNPGAAPGGGAQVDGGGSAMPAKKTPWLIIGGVAAVVLVVIILLVTKKK